MIKKLFGAIAGLAITLGAAIGATSTNPVGVTANPQTAALVSPTNFLASNLVAGAGIVLTKGAGGKLTIAGGGVGSGSIVGATNEGMANPNSIGLDRGTNGGLIQLASLIAGNNIILTNNGTNISITAAVLTGAGIVNLNGQEGVNQTFSTSSSGTDFTIVSSGNNHEFRIPNSSPTSRGLLLSADYAMLLMKQASSMVLSNIVGNGGAITNFNTQTGGTQTLQVGANGADIAWVSTLDTHRLDVPTASAVNRGALAAADFATFLSKQNGSLILSNMVGNGGAITNLAGLTSGNQSLVIGTFGSNLGWSSGGSTHTLNVPTASAVNRGALAAADFISFASKQDGTQTLTNISGTGATTNVINAANGAGMISVLGLTNNGNVRVKTVSQGANITITDNETNLVIASAAGVGEANVNGEISVTNATRFGLVHSKVGITNMLRSVSAGNGLATTNQGTNLVFAALPLDAGLTSLADLASLGFVARTATDTFLERTLTASAPLTISNPSGIAGNPNFLVPTNSASTAGVAPPSAGLPNLAYGTDGASVPGFRVLPSSATTPPGADTEVIFNLGGTWSTDSGILFNRTNDTLTVNTSIVAKVISVVGSGGGQMRMGDDDQTHYAIVKPPSAVTTSYALRLPAAPGTGTLTATVSDSTNIDLAITATGSGNITIQTNSVPVGTNTVFNLTHEGGALFATNNAASNRVEIHFNAGGLRWQTNGVDGSTQAVVNIVGAGAPIVSNNAAGNLTALIFPAAAGSGSGTNSIDLLPQAWQQPTNMPAQIDYNQVTGLRRLLFTTNTSVTHPVYIPANYTGTPAITLWINSTSTVGNALFECSAWAFKTNMNAEAESYDAVNAISIPIMGTVGFPSSVTTALANFDSAAAGSTVNLKLRSTATNGLQIRVLHAAFTYK